MTIKKLFKKLVTRRFSRPKSLAHESRDGSKLKVAETVGSSHPGPVLTFTKGARVGPSVTPVQGPETFDHNNTQTFPVTEDRTMAAVEPMNCADLDAVATQSEDNFRGPMEDGAHYGGGCQLFLS